MAYDISKIQLVDNDGQSLDPATREQMDTVISILNNTTPTITKIDKTSQTDIIYIGVADKGSLDTDTKWTITKINKTTSPITILLSNPNVVWNDRLTTIYS